MRHFGKLWNNYTQPKFQYVIREFKILYKLKVSNKNINMGNYDIILGFILGLLIFISIVVSYIAIKIGSVF